MYSVPTNLQLSRGTIPRVCFAGFEYAIHSELYNIVPTCNYYRPMPIPPVRCIMLLSPLTGILFKANCFIVLM